MTLHNATAENLWTQATVDNGVSRVKLYQDIASNLKSDDIYQYQSNEQSATRQGVMANEATTLKVSQLENVFPIISQFGLSRESKNSFSTLQEWEGHVVHISGDSFTAYLQDLTDRSAKEEEATFPLDELNDCDRKRIEIGSIFRWTIGYRRSEWGTKERVSKIILRDLPVWTLKELDRNAKEAAILVEQFRIE